LLEPDAPFPSLEAAIAFFNGRYMLVNDGGKILIYEPRHDPILHRHYYSHTRPSDFRLAYLNRLVCTGTDKDGNPKFENAADVWLKSPKRKQYLKGFVFDPRVSSSIDPETFNLWRSFNVVPKPGSWDLLKRHLRDVACQGYAPHYNYMLDWLASLVQHPERKGEVCLVLIGPKGAGKSLVGKVLHRILGQHGFVISHAKHLVGNFNSHLRDCVFLLGDEAFYAGDKAHESILKAIITEPTLTIEAKYRDAVNAPNFLHIMLTANPGWVIPATTDERRFCVFLVSGAHVGDFAYFKAIDDEMENDGYGAVLHELLHRDISNFNVRAVPDSLGLQEQKKLSLPTHLAWWMDVLQRGYVWASKLGLQGDFNRWHNMVATELLNASYEAFARGRGERHRMSRETLGRFLRETGATPWQPWTVWMTGEHMTDVKDPITGHVHREAKVIMQLRPHGYRLGTLNDARKAFEAYTKLSIVWS
jgi:hypothetical protein